MDKVTLDRIAAIDAELAGLEATREKVLNTARGTAGRLLAAVLEEDPDDLTDKILRGRLAWEHATREAVAIKDRVRLLVGERKALQPFDARRDYLYRLNAQVAQQVMGLTVIAHDMPLKGGRVIQALSLEDENGARKPIANYASDPSAAAMVMAKVSANRTFADDTWDLQEMANDGWLATVGDIDDTGHTWMEAVSRCALGYYGRHPIDPPVAP